VEFEHRLLRANENIVVDKLTTEDAIARCRDRPQHRPDLQISNDLPGTDRSA
jgi:hypothetical protein